MVLLSLSLWCLFALLKLDFKADSSSAGWKNRFFQLNEISISLSCWLTAFQTLTAIFTHLLSISTTWMTYRKTLPGVIFQVNIKHILSIPTYSSHPSSLGKAMLIYAPVFRQARTGAGGFQVCSAWLCYRSDWCVSVLESVSDRSLSLRT